MLGRDLRTPLTAISASAQLMLKQGDRTNVPRITQRITNSAQRMANLIDEVLDFARGRIGGDLGLSPTDVADFGQAMREIVSEVQLSFPGRLIRCDIDVQGVVLCDRGRVQQVVSTLLVNTLVHGARDKPGRVSAHAEENTVVLTVSNEGEPIDPRNLSKLFEPFSRVNSVESRQGLGRGLYICLQIVKSHAGTLEVTSSAADGTRFAVRVP